MHCVLAPSFKNGADFWFVHLRGEFAVYQTRSSLNIRQQMALFEMVHTLILRFANMVKWINSLNLSTPIFRTLQYVFQEDFFLFFDTKCKMSALKKTKNTYWMIKLVCKCSHSKSHSINHKQNYSESLSDVSCVEIRFTQTSSP